MPGVKPECSQFLRLPLVLFCFTDCSLLHLPGHCRLCCCYHSLLLSLSNVAALWPYHSSPSSPILLLLFPSKPCLICFRRFQRDLQSAVQFIQAPGPLKEAVKQLYRAHCKQSLDTSSIEQEVLSEYDRQREFLEKTVDTLKHKLRQEVATHQSERGRDMLVGFLLLGMGFWKCPRGDQCAGVSGLWQDFGLKSPGAWCSAMFYRRREEEGDFFKPICFEGAVGWECQRGSASFAAICQEWATPCLDLSQGSVGGRGWGMHLWGSQSIRCPVSQRILQIAYPDCNMVLHH